MLIVLLSLYIRCANKKNASLLQGKAEVMTLTLHYSDGSITEKGIRIAPGFIRQNSNWETESRGYTTKIYGPAGNVLHYVSIGDPSVIFYDYLLEEEELRGGTVKLNETDFVVRLPVLPNMAKIEILSPEGKIVWVRSITNKEIEKLRKKGGYHGKIW
ncbi:MAG: hypothetical protein QMD71_07455 [bacterium]|nr:hypothetical protein [bacterium]